MAYRTTNVWTTAEPLEPRVLLAAFASVGMDYDAQGTGAISVTVFATEGDVTSDGATTGSQFRHGPTAREGDGALKYSSLTRLADGRFSRDPNRGRLDDPSESNGAQFLADDGFSAGWWYGTFEGPAQEIEYIVQRPTSAAIGDLAGSWRFSMVRAEVEVDDFSNVTGTLSITGSNVQWTSTVGTLPRESSALDGFTADGLGSTAEGEYFYLSADGNTLLYADMADSDNIVSIAVATREDAMVAASDVAGGYLLTWAVTGPPAREEVDRDIVYVQRFLSLGGDGTFQIFDLDEYDDGDRSELSSGTWTREGSTITLKENGNPEDLASLTIGTGSRVLLGTTLNFDGVTEPILGVATRPTSQSPSTETILAVAATTAAPRGVVYELAGDRTWFVSDIQDKAGGPAIEPESVVAWQDAKDGRSYAAALSRGSSSAPAGQVLVYRAGDNGAWTVRNLTTELGSSSTVRIARELNIMIGVDGIAHLLGLSEEGWLMRYYQTGATLAGTEPAEFTWAFSNVEKDELDPQGLDTPQYAGDLVPYATSWGGLNVAGIDGDGKIWSVWWAPGLTNWTVSNLSQDTGAPPLVGGLTVYLTSWQGINIAGIDQNGNLRVTWWVPELGGEWSQSDLNELTPGSVKLSPDSVSSYVTSWDGLNIAGIDIATGDTVVFWWVPREVDTGWSVSSITDVLPPGSPELVRDVLGISASDSSLNLFGYAENDNFLRYFWEPASDTWTAQDLTTIAVSK